MLPAGTQGLLQKSWPHSTLLIYIYTNMYTNIYTRQYIAYIYIQIYIQIYILERRALLYKIRIFLENYPKFANI